MLVSDRDEELLFRSRQLETIAWCSERLRRKDPAGSLQTAVLRPALVNIEAQNQGSWNYEVKDPTGGGRSSLRKTRFATRRTTKSSRRPYRSSGIWPKMVVYCFLGHMKLFAMVLLLKAPRGFSITGIFLHGIHRSGTHVYLMIEIASILGRLLSFCNLRSKASG
jgi:hypothetical protein